jgi:hypothetical protein
MEPFGEMGKTTLTRRTLLGGAALAATAAVAGGVTEFTSPSPARTRVGLPGYVPMRQASFEKLVGTSFDVEVGHATRTVTLASVKPLNMVGVPRHRRAGGAKTTGEQYQLFFRGPASRTFSQGTYTFTSRQMGSQGLFVVPVGQPDSEQTYQAVIVNV